jgi:hypothetical protein
MGERATREIWICGPGAYVILKVLAFSLRGENKDAYDLFYVLRNYGAGVGEIVEHLDPMRTDPVATEAMAILRRDFTDQDGPGPLRVGEFLTGGSDDTIQADVAGFMDAFLRIYERT